MRHKYYQWCRSVNVNQGYHACNVVNVVTRLLCLCIINVKPGMVYLLLCKCTVDKYGLLIAVKMARHTAMKMGV